MTTLLYDNQIIYNDINNIIVIIHIGKFPLGLLHQKRPPQVPSKQCFPCILWTKMELVGAFFGGPTQVEN
jgi:hypothetical protein